VSVIEAKRSSTTTILVIALALAAVIGVLLGWVIPDVMLGAEFLGKLFLGLLSLFVIPVILTATITGVAGVGRFAKLGAPLGRILPFFVAITAVGVVLGGLVGTLLAPGSAVDHAYAAMVVSPASINTTSVSGILSGIIGGHVLQMVSTESYLGLVLLALALGVVLSSMGNAGRTAMSFFRALNDALMRLVGYLMYAAPVGILFLVGGAVARQAALGPHWTVLLGGLSMAVAAALLVQGIIVLPLALFILNGRSPFKLLAGLGPALLVGLGLGSSAATLPVTYRCAVGSGQVEPRAAAVALPLGMVINRSGTAIYMMVASLFAAQMFGVSLGPLDLILLGLAALVLSLFGAATPMVTLVGLPFVVNLFDIHPAQAAVAAGVIAAGDWLLVRLATVINVWGDAVGGAFLSAPAAVQTPAGRSSERRDQRPAGEREPRETYERAGRDNRPGRGRRGSREPRITGHRTERRPDLPPAPRPVPGAQGAGRPTKDDNSPFNIRTSDRPILEVASHDDTSAAARASEPRPPVQERRPEPPAGRQSRQGYDYNRGRGSRRLGKPSGPGDNGRSLAPERSEAETTAGRMSQTKVARELTRVTEHLRRIEAQTSRPSDDQVPPAEEGTPVDNVEDPEMMTAAEVYARRAAEETEPDPELELETEDEPEDEPEPDAEEEPELELEFQNTDDEDINIPEADEEEASEWGRQRRYKDPKRRGEEPSGGDQESGETTDATPQESFSNEQVSFGRGKRRKPRA